MPIKNRVRYWRMQMGIHDLIKFAEIVNCSTWLLERWEEQKTQPTLESLCKLRERLKPFLPGLTLDDLVDYFPEEQDLDS